MMRTVAAIACLYLAVSGLLCREQNPESGKAAPATDSVKTHAAHEADTTKLAHKLTSLRSLQATVMLNSRESAPRSSLLNASFDTLSGCFLVTGKGVINPEHPEGARSLGRERAAKYDAERWSLYLKEWRLGQERAYGSAIGGSVAYSRILYERIIGDTLLVLTQVPVASIVLE